MIVIGGLLIGSALYAGIKVRNNRHARKETLRNRQHFAVSNASENAITLDPKTPGDKNYPVATAALGLTIAGQVLFAPLTLLGIGGMVYLLWPTWKQAYHDLRRRRRFTSIALEAIVLPGTILAGQYVAAALAFWFLYFALNNVAKAKENATKNLASVFVAPSNQVAYVLREGVEVELSLKDIQVGDILVVGAGEIIPVDGVIVQGQATVDQHMLTGESQPVEKQPDDPVFAATLLLDGHIRLKVEKTGEETIANQTRRILDGMISYTDNLELRGTDASDRMALPLFMLGSATSLFKGAHSGLAIFWTPLDDALYAAGPLGVLNFLNIALQRGILVKDGRALEILRRVDTIVFDKTGTLTNEVPQVVRVHACGEFSRSEVLGYAAAAEQKQLHPVALAILEAASTQGLELPAVQVASYKTGYGLEVSIGERTVQIGSHRFMQQLALAIPDQLQAVQSESHEYGYSLIYLAVDESVIGAIELHANIRPETRETIDRLHELGYQVCIISGDHEKPTRHLARQLDIDRYFAETLPQDKADLIKTMQDEGRVVCYVGDGINDTIALKKAEVSVSLRGASTIATDTAQIVLMNEKLCQLIDLIGLSKRLDDTYRNTVLSGAIPSVGIVGGVLLFHLTLPAAILGYAAGMSLSVAHAMLPLLKERRNARRDTPPGNT